MRREPLPVARALVSVWDKTGLEPFCRALTDLGIEVVSSGGTARALEKAGIPVVPVSQVTGFPEILDGRVKTLNPMIHGGILARKEIPDHLKQLEEHSINPFDLVVVNLYPFEAVTRQSDTSLEEAIEMIDIGGVALLRAAAKNFNRVTVLSDPEDYKNVLDQRTSMGFRRHGTKGLSTYHPV